MNYVAVLGAAVKDLIAEISFTYFPNYLVSMAEPTTSRSWTLLQIDKQVRKILKLKKKFQKQFPDIKDEIKLFIDSGGFQIIQGYIVKSRVKEYIGTYHSILEWYYKDIDRIFSLDIMNKGWSKEELIKLNDYSIDRSIALIKKIPEIKDKQLFIVQTRNIHVFDLWKDLMDKHNVYQYYERYSFGGLVGLKKETNAKFSHIIPFVFWLINKVKKNNGKITQIHLLGQSSKLMIFSTVFLERLLSFYGINIQFTMDSSELIRFAKIEHKLPILCNDSGEYKFIRELDNLNLMLKNHQNLSKEDLKNLDKKEELLCKHGKLESKDFVEFMCQNINNAIDLSHLIIDNKSHDELLNLLDYSEKEIKEMHPVFEQGRFAAEVYNNLKIIKDLLPSISNDSFDINDINIEKYCKDILKKY
jgi:hypothetical protein